MSHAGILNLAAGPVPPAVATSYVTDNGTAVPLANILRINGKESNINNDNGIIVNGGVVGTGTSNEVDVVLTNRITGTVTTTDATPTTLVSVSLGSIPGVYFLQGNLMAYSLTDAVGAAYSFESGAFTDGVTGTEIGTEQKSTFEPVILEPSDFIITVIGNNAICEVTGIAGKTINWNGFFTYRFVG